MFEHTLNLDCNLDMDDLFRAQEAMDMQDEILLADLEDLDGEADGE